MIGIIIVLKKEELLDDILSAFAELEIFDMSILDGNNLEGILEKDLPLFAGLLVSTNRKMLYNKFIFGVCRKEEEYNDLIKLFKKNKIDFTKNNMGFITTFKLTDFIGE